MSITYYSHQNSLILFLTIVYCILFIYSGHTYNNKLKFKQVSNITYY
jgi:hypothetical protein